MQPQPTPARLAPTATGILVVDGYGVRIHVDHGRLVVADGTGRTRRVGHFDRATSRLRRLVLLGHTGSMTIDAIRWLSDVGVGFTVIDPDGMLLVASAGMGRDDPRLRRAQALAIDTTTGDDVARRLLGEKVAGQATTLAAHADQVMLTDTTAEEMRRAAARLHVATTRDELRLAEAQAAVAYWEAWANVPVRFTGRDVGRVPDHWRIFGARRSPLTGNPRLAANPANALLNYLYAILEAEARLACLTVGLDPGLGVLHADLKARDSLALDVMEVVRPKVDAYVLDLLGVQIFRAADFHETRQGICRVLEPLSHRLAETGPRWAQALAPVVESVARHFIVGVAPDAVTPTPLTGANRSAGRARGSLAVGPRPARSQAAPRLLPTCERCGAGLSRSALKFCDACRQSVVHEQRAAFAAAGNIRLAELRSRGQKPGVGGDAGRLRGAKVAVALRANHAWERSHPGPTDPRRFARESLPLLISLSASEMVVATGFSRGYATAILNGRRVPHPRWWSTLGVLGTEQMEAASTTEKHTSRPERAR